MLATKARVGGARRQRVREDDALPHEVALFVALAGSTTGRRRKDGTRIARPRAGVRTLVRVQPRQRHTWNMARAALPHGLVFASAHMPRPS